MFMRPNFEKQIEDLVFAIESKFGKDIANEIENMLNKRKADGITYLKNTYM